MSEEEGKGYGSLWGWVPAKGGGELSGTGSAVSTMKQETGAVKKSLVIIGSVKRLGARARSLLDLPMSVDFLSRVYVLIPLSSCRKISKRPQPVKAVLLISNVTFFVPTSRERQGYPSRNGGST